MSRQPDISHAGCRVTQWLLWSEGYKLSEMFHSVQHDKEWASYSKKTSIKELQYLNSF
jgi:hypothetical protein